MTDTNKLRDTILDMEASLSTNLNGYSMWHYGADIHGITRETLKNAIEALKAQEPATEQPKRIDLQEETKAWLDEMDAVEVLGTIADICQDWDGYRTANGLGGLINEIWAYARYCADRLLKAQQEPRVMTLEEVLALKENTPVYIEDLNGYHGWDVYVGIDPVDNDITTGAPWSPSEYWPQSSYLDAWRCWTSCPTKEQMEATPWN